MSDTGADLHDPGGKSHFRLPNGVYGAADFSPCGQYRYWLTRDWGLRRFTDGRERFVLWIGMNPSTARADTDDQTIRREMYYTSRLQYNMFVKCNVMDYRATNPRDLLKPGVVPRSDKNLETIKFFANKADYIFVAWGTLHRKLQDYAMDVVEMLESASGTRFNCLGINADGSPKHPSRLANDVKFEKWYCPIVRIKGNAA